MSSLLIDNALGNCPNYAQIGEGAQIFPTFLMGLFMNLCILADPNQYSPDYDSQKNDEFDFIVVGGGSAGSVVAARLAEEYSENNQKKFTVLLIEAGGDPSLNVTIPGLYRNSINTNEDWQYYAEPSDKYCRGAQKGRCYWPRGKVLGGSGSVNAMAYNRGLKSDYDQWEKMGNIGWNSTNMLYYFKKSEGFQTQNDPSNDIIVDEEYHNRNGPLHVKLPSVVENSITRRFLMAGKELGYQIVDPNGKHPFGFARGHFTISEGKRVSAATAFLKPLSNAKNLFIIKHAQVTQIVFNNKNRAIGVKYYKNNTEYTIHARNEIILSAGTINTPQILLHSGIGPKEQLEPLNITVISDLPVGKNLQDHIRHHVYYKFNAEPTIAREDDIYLYLKNQTGLFAQNREYPMSFSGFINSDGNLNDSTSPDIQIQSFYQKKGTQFHDTFHWFNVTHLERANGYLANSTICALVLFLRRPTSTGRLYITNNNPLEPIKIVPNYFANQDDIKKMIGGIRQLERLAKTDSLKDLLSGPVFFTESSFQTDTDEYWEEDLRNFASTIFHPVGTCKMAPLGDPTGVVSPKLLVKGVERLRIVDASIMPTVPSANTHAPSIAIGEKGADLIKQDY